MKLKDKMEFKLEYNAKWFEYEFLTKKELDAQLKEYLKGEDH